MASHLAPVALLLATLGAVSASSSVYPLLFNPYDVSHWKCFGYTAYENTQAAANYTYEVDLCFMAALGLKLSFPWLYQYYTGTRREYCAPSLQVLVS